MPNVLRIGVLSALLGSAAMGQDIIGDWHGTLKAGGAELHLVLHFTKGSNGALAATMDSVDQGGSGIPVTSVTLEDSRLKLSIDAVHGSYEGKVNAATSAISGIWSQGQPLPLEFERGPLPQAAEQKAAKPSDIDGAWAGTIDMGAIKLRIVFHIVNTADGLKATADSPDQNAKGLPVSSVTRTDDTLRLEMKALGASFEGKIAADLRTATGTFSQNGGNFPLVLTHTKDSAFLERPRPQNPTNPYPYREEEVAYENAAQHVRFAGAL